MFLKNISFRIKILIIIFAAMLIPTVSVGMIMYVKSEKAITDQTSMTITNSMDFVIGNIDSSLDIIKEMSMSILTDERLISIVNSDGSLALGGKEQKYSELCDLLSVFSNRIKNTYMLSEIDSYNLYIPALKTLIDSKTTYTEDLNADNIGFMQEFNANPDNDAWFMTYPFSYGSLGLNESRLVGEKLITCNRVLKGDDKSVKAVLAINIDANFISDSLNRIQTGTFGEIIAMDMDGSLLAYSDKHITVDNPDNYTEINSIITNSGALSGSFFHKRDKENDFVIYSVSGYTGWRYVVIIPTSQILGQVMNEVQKFLLLLIGISAALVLVTTYFLSYTFYKPLEKLVWAMQELEKRNLEVHIDDKRGDEYHRVYRGFNDMVTEINRLLKDLVTEKLLNKEAEIKLLQAQINPHFLYNTLESIYSIARIKKVDEISQMVMALSKFFRISLSGGKEIVALRDAADLVVNYLTIQNIRFKGKIIYTIDIPGDLMNCMVPKLILQTVIENSIYHGLEPKKSEGTLTISAKAENGSLKLSVEDDGVGIPEKELAGIRQSIESNSFEDSSNYALKNLNRQIKLMYGPEYGISIDSAEGLGTKVSIVTPIVMERGGPQCISC